MKILLINSVCGVGSTGKICVDLAKCLNLHGHECVIAYGRGKAKGYDNTYKITSSIGNKLHYIKSRLFDKHGLGNARETNRFIKFIDKYNPDIIHLHNIHGYYLNYRILFEYLKRSRAKVVWTLHDMWLATGHCAYYLKCTKWENGCHHCSKLNEYPKALFDNSKRNYELKKEAFNSVADLTLVPVSSWINNEIKKSYLKKLKTVIINNGIDLNVFKPEETDFRKKNNLKGKKILLAVADRWTERKGFTDFMILSQKLDENTKLIMVGLTEEQRAQLPSNIIGITRTENQQQLAEIYSTADLFLNFTYSDNFPTVNLESLACGTPVLTYNTGGSPEMLSEQTGYVIEPGDVSKVLEIVNKFVKTEEIKNTCVSHAKQYDKNLQFIKYEDLYKSYFKSENE